MVTAGAGLLPALAAFTAAPDLTGRLIGCSGRAVAGVAAAPIASAAVAASAAVRLRLVMRAGPFTSSGPFSPTTPNCPDGINPPLSNSPAKPVFFGAADLPAGTLPPAVSGFIQSGR